MSMNKVMCAFACLFLAVSSAGAQELRMLVKDVKPALRFPFNVQNNGSSGASVSTYMEGGTSQEACKLSALQVAKAIMLGTKYKVSSVYVRYYDQNNQEHWIDVSVSESAVRSYCKGGHDQERVLSNLKSYENVDGIPADFCPVGSTPDGSVRTYRSGESMAKDRAAWQDAVYSEKRAREALDSARKRLHHYTPGATAYNEYNPTPEKEIQEEVDSALRKWQAAQAEVSRTYVILEKAQQRSAQQGASASVSNTQAVGANNRLSGGADSGQSIGDLKQNWQEASRKAEDARRAADAARKDLANFTPVLSSDDSYNDKVQARLQKAVENADREWQQARNKMDRAYNALQEAKSAQR